MTREEFIDGMELDASDNLLAARWVSLSKHGTEDNEMEKMYREIKKHDPKAFLVMLGKLENDLMVHRRASVAEQAQTGVDEGTDKALELSEQLLRDILANEKIKCPQCGCEFLEQA